MKSYILLYVLRLFFFHSIYSFAPRFIRNRKSNNYMNVLDKDTSNDLSEQMNANSMEETNMEKLLKLYRNNSGFDETYSYKNETEDNDLLYNIKMSMIKYEIVKQLESPHVSENTKIELLHENRHLFDTPQYVKNITAGGLFTDWDFTL